MSRRTTSIALLLAATAVLAIALGPAAERASDETLTAHMWQHAALMLIAAPLIALAAPVRLMLGLLPRARARRAVRVVRHPAVRALTHPLAATALLVAVLFLVHVPAVYDAALAVPAVHVIEHGALLWTAVLWWVSIIGRDAVPTRSPASVLAAGILGMTAMAIVGGVLSASPAATYGHYRDALGDAAAVADQRTAGGIMSVGGMVIALPLLLVGALRALWREERAAQARERRVEAGHA